MVTKQRVSSAQWKQAFPVLPSLVKMQGVEEICRAQIETPIILLRMKFELHNIPVVFKIFPLLNCIFIVYLKIFY